MGFGLLGDIKMHISATSDGGSPRRFKTVALVQISEK